MLGNINQCRFVTSEAVSEGEIGENGDDGAKDEDEYNDRRSGKEGKFEWAQENVKYLLTYDALGSVEHS